MALIRVQQPPSCTNAPPHTYRGNIAFHHYTWRIFSPFRSFFNRELKTAVDYNNVAGKNGDELKSIYHAPQCVRRVARYSNNRHYMTLIEWGCIEKGQLIKLESHNKWVEEGAKLEQRGSWSPVQF